MQFRTQFSIDSQEPKIDHTSRIFLTGSCFVENIGAKLDYYKFQNLQNPFGILFHPAAIEKFITNAVNENQYSREDIFFHNERWHCFDAHSALSSPDEVALLKSLNRNLQKTREYLQESTHVIITLGTSWVYRNMSSAETVANCHKLPQKNFSKEITGVEQIYNHLKSTISAIKRVNSQAEIVFTISPVRHLKDGVIQNQRSKAHLIAALHKVMETQGKYGLASYFPAYELMMDDLRDYRFYTEDMLHPNDTAIEYIWQKFVDSRISPESVPLLKEIESIQKSLKHKAFNSDSESHKNFRKSLETKIHQLQKKYPHLNF
ncbi:GSCFA domain-containing protein [Gillisia limnaea]|uniref:GSCFA domain protein n=1 Tax=Gillisia limnaea (strain DSM 15749 / LMG 21470 / R-8282) TaxID=865937 RepID=H2BTE2_GILLR|nr:GSCFA domain-containing protein [Gillisia limnaea]EHQ03741.1 GSCFA domain protein [Gillisia limnaea DSM 15749]